MSISRYIERYSAVILTLLVVFTISLSIIGGFRAYTEMPINDMWGAYVGMQVRINEGHWQTFFYQHNEHRIFITRILFYINQMLLWDSNGPLIVVNYILVGLITLTFWRIVQRTFPHEEEARKRHFLIAFLTIMLFHWVQHENLTWAFQSQFFLVYLLPISAFYFLALYAETLKTSDFVFAVLLGVASGWTMANGLLAMPLMVLMAIFLRINKLKIIVLLGLTIANMYGYLNDFQTIPIHADPVDSISSHPIDVILYTLVYLGGPVYNFAHFVLRFVIQNYELVQYICLSIAAVAGLLLITGSALFLLCFLRQKERNSVLFVLFAVLLFIGASAGVTALGRVNFGLLQATTSRYNTTAIMGWSAFLILVAYYKDVGLVSFRPIINKAVLFVSILFLCAASISQLKVFENRSARLHGERLAVLALELGVNDSERVRYVYPDYEIVQQLADFARQHNVSVFGRAPYSGLREKMGQQIALDKINASRMCRGFYGETEMVPDNDVIGRAVNGWIVDQDNETVPEVLYLLDQKHKIIGIALSGAPRDDVANYLENKSFRFSGFSGYVQKDATIKMVYAAETGCHIKIG